MKFWRRKIAMTKPSIIRQYVDGLTEDQRIEIVRNYKQFEKDGFIGDAPIRTHAKNVLDKHGIARGMIVMWMERLVFEILMKDYESNHDLNI